MGARVDAPAAGAFVVIFAAFLILRHRVLGAIRAREERSRFERTLQQAEVRTLGGEAAPGELEDAQLKMATLQRREEDARTVTGPFGYSFRLMVPNAPNNNDNSRQARREANADGGSGGDDGGGRGADDEIKKLGPGQYVVLGLVLLSQIWLLAVLSADPMSPPSDMFYATFGN
ncbi:hypothetical protein JKP88DRAFT_224991 [Tribonema minus]|uniref:Uncharacterized protein n=1 Tax=Tribonema minus TaxID=303371 RepID=A0A835YYH6_9STRA|nr:hypothetical protein JKP88DRAFT_224991 [Tribonema minus]